jgi:hypothetical protein
MVPSSGIKTKYFYATEEVMYPPRSFSLRREREGEKKLERLKM